MKTVIERLKRRIRPEHIVLLLSVVCLLALFWLLYIESFWVALPETLIIVIIYIITNNEKK